MGNDKAIGVDGYNSSITGDVSPTVTCSASDFHHVPVVIEKKKRVANADYKRRGEEDRRCGI